MSTRWIWPVAYALFLIPAHAWADRPVDLENGAVLIGTAEPGPDLDPSVIPDLPLLLAIDSPYEIFSDTGTLIHVAAWTPDGDPARSAQVYLAEHYIGRTDEHGTLLFRWGIPGVDVNDYWLSRTNITIHYELGGLLYGAKVGFSAMQRTGSFASDQLFVYTDRGIYNPGDTMFVRGIAWNLRSDYRPVEGGEVEVLLEDPDGRVIAGGTGVTDEFGVMAVDLDVSERAEEGIYRLVAVYDDATARARIRVQRYTPPVIDIQHTLGRFLTPAMDHLDFSVTLAYFTEHAFTNGRVAFDVLVDGESRYHSDRDVSGPGPHHFSIGAEMLDAIRLGVLEDEYVEVELRAWDSFGREDSLIRELLYTVNPYVAVLDTERDRYTAGDPVAIVVRLSDLDRVPVRDKPFSIITSMGTQLDGVTDDAGTAQVSFTMPSGDVGLDLRVDDVSRAIASTTVRLQVEQPMRSHVEDAIIQEGTVVPISVTFPAGFVPAESVVHIDVVDTSGALINAVLLPVDYRDGVWSAAGSFEAPSWGSMLLTLFCLGRDNEPVGALGEGQTALGLMAEGQSLVVHPNRELTIHLDGVPDSLAPGEEFKGTVTVTDPFGNLVEAVVGASVTDMAVISLKDPLEITPMDIFYNPRLRTISTTGSAMLTWPVVSRNWGSSRHDIALPPFPYRSGGTIVGVWGARAKLDEDPDASYGTEEGGALSDTELALLGMDGYSIIGDYGNEVVQETEGVDAPIITIRTEFPDTSLWAPLLYTEDGALEVTGVLPDAITTQRITLVASDENGGVGVLHVPIEVTQPLYVLTDLPETLSLGDEVEARVLVQNLSDETLELEVTLFSEGLDVDDDEELELSPGESRLVIFELEAEAVGWQTFTVTAASESRVDSEVREVYVRPVGTPTITEYSGTMSASERFVETVEIPGGGQQTVVSLDVVFPSVTAAFAGLDAVLDDWSGGDLMDTGGELVASVLVYEHLKEIGYEPRELSTLQAKIEGRLSVILIAQRQDGGWGFWWDSESSPFVTGYVLEALTALHEADFMVPREALRSAVDYLATSFEPATSRFNTDAIAWWEGDQPEFQLAMTAEIFSAMSDVPLMARTSGWTRSMRDLSALFQGYLSTVNPDVLTLSHAILGLNRLRDTRVATADLDTLLTATRRLDRTRTVGHWEPGWFHAYGGTIEATVTALEVYAEMGDVDRLAVDARGAVRYLLSTREGWGGWHSPRGTASAIAGILMLAGTLEEEVASTVSVLIDGGHVTSVDIDPADPFASALALRALDLTPYLSDGGEHEVEVIYDGNLRPSVHVAVSHWDEPEALASSVLTLEAELSDDETEVDQVIFYTLHLGSTSSSRQSVSVAMAAPSNAEVDRRSLDSLVERGLIDAYAFSEGGIELYCTLDGYAQRELPVRLIGRREGDAIVPVAVASVRNVGSAIAVAHLDDTLSVE